MAQWTLSTSLTWWCHGCAEGGPWSPLKSGSDSTWKILRFDQSTPTWNQDVSTPRKPKNRGAAPVFENTAEVGGTNAIDHIACSIFHVFFSQDFNTGVFKVYICLNTCLPFTREFLDIQGMPANCLESTYCACGDVIEFLDFPRCVKWCYTWRFWRKPRSHVVLANPSCFLMFPVVFPQCPDHSGDLV